MPVQTALWRVGAKPEQIKVASLANERQLEDMIAADMRVLSDEWMVIGRQVATAYGGRIDLLAIAPDASLVLIELKRDKSPRDVVAQALDYAGWVEQLKADEIRQVYHSYAPEKNLGLEFRARFGRELDEENLNSTHQVVVVASALDAATERILRYLRDRDVPINVLCFQVFTLGSDQILSRSWLHDPAEVQATTISPPDRQAEPWNGEVYACFGHDRSRSWEDAVEFGFISAGGGEWYSRTLNLLKEGDRVWVKVPAVGYVGVGRVTGTAEPLATFKVQTPTGPKRLVDITQRATYLREFIDDPTKSEYLVPVHWLQTVPLNSAVNEVGMFGNQNSVCKPTTPKWRNTVDELKRRFPHYDDVPAA